MKSDLNKEKELLELVKKDKQSFGELYKYFLNDVYRFSYSILNNEHDAQDITSQVFMEFYIKLDGFQWQNISLKYWLFTTARNLSYKRFRKPVMTEFDENAHIENEPEISFVDQIINLDLVEQVKSEIQKLSGIEQELITLRIWEDMQFGEIATIQGISENAAKKRFYKAIDKLKATFDSKSLKTIIALPVLFTAIKQVAASPAYAASDSLISGHFENGIFIKNKLNMETITNTPASFLKSKVGIVTIVGLTAVVAVSSIFIYKYVAKSKDSTDKNSSVVTPTPTSTASTSRTEKTLTLEESHGDFTTGFSTADISLEVSKTAQLTSGSVKDKDYQLSLILLNEFFAQEVPAGYKTVGKTSIGKDLFRFKVGATWDYTSVIITDCSTKLEGYGYETCAPPGVAVTDLDVEIAIGCKSETEAGLAECDEIAKSVKVLQVNKK
jgi:RNA polymerase sigma factor (sigma-70 family)